MRIFHPTYFPSIQQYSLMLNDTIIFEIQDNFQKQTYRNRSYIYGANGKQLLSVPVHKVTGRQLTKNIKIDYSSEWQSEHLKTLLSAYSSSPFFEFYIDDLVDIFYQKHILLLDLNISIFKKITELLQEKITFNKTTIYNVKLKNDYRFLVNAKANTIELPKYTQVFDNKHGFLTNLSILDLLFMEGPAAIIYLESITEKLTEH